MTTFQCPTCTHTFTSPRAFAAHVKSCTTIPLKVFSKRTSQTVWGLFSALWTFISQLLNVFWANCWPAPTLFSWVGYICIVWPLMYVITYHFVFVPCYSFIHFLYSWYLWILEAIALNEHLRHNKYVATVWKNYPMLEKTILDYGSYIACLLGMKDEFLKIVNKTT
jgi:hypothetical protein